MEWFIEAWNELDENLIVNSFRNTGITNSDPENFNSILNYARENDFLTGEVLTDAEEYLKIFLSFFYWILKLK